MSFRFALLALSIAGMGCQIEREPATRGPSLAEKVQTAQARMHERFESARRIEQALAGGQLEVAHREARMLAILDEPEILPRWLPYFDRILAAAHQIERAPDITGAARAAAALGKECARCHEAAAAQISFSAEPRPLDGRGLPTQMRGHQWAATRMWEGLIGPSNERWKDGAVALAQSSLTIATEEPMTVALKNLALADGDKIADDVARVRLFANRAVAAYDQDARSEIFGNLLVTCAHCHSVLRGH